VKSNSMREPATRRAQVARAGKLTFGIDLGDRTSRYCVLNEEGEVLFEGSVPTTKSGMNQVFWRDATVPDRYGDRC
jgi:transposase